VQAVGDHLDARLRELVGKYPGVALESRGRGLLRGLRVKSDPSGLVARAREQGVLFSVAGADVVRFVPPLVVSKTELDEAVGVLAGAIAERVEKEGQP
jgi:acetylornithine/succinyldiaminopimelate/putrescine aminotransferase